MKKITGRAWHLAAATALALTTASTVEAGEVMGGARFGIYTDVSEAFLGGELLVGVDHRLFFNPNVEVVLVDDGSYMTFNADFHYDFPQRSTTFWLGAGLAVIRIDPPGPFGADSDVGANLLAGLGFRAGSVIPYLQAKVIVGDDTELALAAGLRF